MIIKLSSSLWGYLQQQLLLLLLLQIIVVVMFRCAPLCPLDFTAVRNRTPTTTNGHNQTMTNHSFAFPEVAKLFVLLLPHNSLFD